ncbi:MAG: metallophosphoesterase [Syntrophaceae bacterium]
MYLFLLSILGIYGAVHAYFFTKARAALGFGIRGGLLLSVFLLLMCIAPVLVRVMERMGYECAGRVLAVIGYAWMGFVFLFFCLSVLMDITQLVIQGLGAISPWCAIRLSLSSRLAFSVPLCLALCLAIYSYYQAWQIRPHHITITSAKIPAETGRVRIVQLADVHLGLMVRERRLQKIMEVVRQAEPDLLVSTGDLVDGQIDSLTGLAGFLRDIRPRYGKYAVTGNHEFYAGLEHALDFMHQAGFVMLRGEKARVNDFLAIVGIDDPAGKAFGLWRAVDETQLLSGSPGDEFVLLLKHLPRVNVEACGRFDLQLSGHTHKGQIFPFSLITRLFFPYHAGWYDLLKGSGLYVSNGTGTWGPPMRLLAPPEVTVIDLVSEP